MPAATGDAPVLSSLEARPGGTAAGALTATRSAPPAAPAALRGLPPFSCSRTPARLRCSTEGLLRGHRVRVDYVAFAAGGVTRAHVGAARADAT